MATRLVSMVFGRIVDAEIELHLLGLFTAHWHSLESQGVCDGEGGQEYRRILNEWLLTVVEGRREPVRDFIRQMPNATPF